MPEVSEKLELQLTPKLNELGATLVAKLGIESPTVVEDTQKTLVHGVGAILGIAEAKAKPLAEKVVAWATEKLSGLLK